MQNLPQPTSAKRHSFEDELEIEIDDEQLGQIQTIGDLFKAIEGKKRQNRQV